jgi:WD40 repeat protein
MPDLSKPTLAWELPWDADWVTAVAFPGPRRIAAGNNLGHVLLWELPEKAGGEAPLPIARLDGHTNVVSRLAAPPGGKTLLSASYDHTIRIWELPAQLPAASETVALNAVTLADRKRRGGKVPPALEAKVAVLKPARTLTEHKEWVVGLRLTDDGRTMITGDDAGHVLVWDRPADTVAKRWQVKGWAYAVALSNDRKLACVGERYPLVFDGGRHAGLKLWDAVAGEVVKDLSADFKGFHMSAAAFSPDGKVLAVGRGGEADGTNGTVTLLEVPSGKKLRALAPGHLNGLTDLAWHPDGKHIASSGRDTVVRVWEAESGKLVAELGKPRGGQFKDWVCAFAWSADGAWLAAADMAGAVQVWQFPG